MILQQFPDLTWLKRESERRFVGGRNYAGAPLPNQGWPNVVLNVKSGPIYRDNIRGPLSIFSNFSGDSYVELKNRRFKIRDGFFLLTNHDQHYTLGVEKKAETANIHFGEYFAEQVLSSVQRRPDFLLDNLFTPEGHVQVANCIQPNSARLTSLLRETVALKSTGLVLEEKLFEIMMELLSHQADDKKRFNALPSLRKSTRDEITKRMQISRDLIYSNYDADVSLDELASASCLSKFHYLRLFKIAFGKTPHQFLNEVRVQRAKELLKHSKMEVRHISSMVGMKDSTSFSRLFRSQVGVYPAHFRANS